MTPNQSAMLLLKDFRRRDLPKIIEWNDYSEAELKVMADELLILFRDHPETPPIVLLYDFQDRMTSYSFKKPSNKNLFMAASFLAGLLVEKLLS